MGEYFRVMPALLCLSALAGNPAAAVDNVHYFGNLVAEPCGLLPEDENIVVEFGTVIEKYLYLNGRTHSQPFALRLVDCDISLGKTVSVSFSGTESVPLPGLLALDGGSTASGIAIGLETQDGKALPLNQKSGAQELTDGNNQIALQAYVQGEPEAIANQAITRGPFIAVATFNLEYE
ncbi:fimbrial protein domain-containing protein [Serratia marcescens]|nr:fimbrial protein domain-containing protein [Serratia marcescens]HEJ0329750.1 fimbrial protein [Serratia marcescens]